MFIVYPTLGMGNRSAGVEAGGISLTVTGILFGLCCRAVSSMHSSWGEVAVGVSGVVGLWGVVMARREQVPRAFYWAVGVAIAGMLAQVTMGVIAMSAEDFDPGNQHVFYGVVVAVTFAFAYIYRAQFRKRPALYYGLLLLFTMGLGIRGIMTFGNSF